eukprot:PITA_16378
MYKEKVRLNLDKVLAAGIIEAVEESAWVSPLVVNEKKQKDKIRIYVDLRNVNDACVHNPFPTPFTDKVLENIGGQEAYLFTDGFSRIVKHHAASLHLMLDTCRKYQIVLNMKKCLFCVPFGIFLGHVVRKQGLMVDLAKIGVIVNLEAPRSVKQLHAMSGHTGYYEKFIKAYAQITMPMEKLLKKDSTFCWDEECQAVWTC